MLTLNFTSSKTGVQLVGYPVNIYEVEPDRGDLYAVTLGKRTHLVQLLATPRDNRSYSWGCKGVAWFRRDDLSLVYAISFAANSDMTRCKYFAQEACVD